MALDQTMQARTMTNLQLIPEETSQNGLSRSSSPNTQVEDIPTDTRTTREASRSVGGAILTSIEGRLSEDVHTPTHAHQDPFLSCNTVQSVQHDTTKDSSQHSRTNITAVLASYRRAAERAERGSPAVPTRSTSKTRPSKRKRHDDFLALHRNSCQLFSSLDGTLAQMRVSTSSSSSSSSASSSRSSPISAPSTREASLDYNHVNQLLGPTSTDSNGIRSLNTKPAQRRPQLQRMHYTVSPTPPTATQDSISCTLPKIPMPQQSSATSSILSSPTTPLVLKALPPNLTARSTYSSQTTLPLPQNLSRQSTTNPASATTIHWTSPTSRRKEYAKIDAANTGFRGFLRNVFPKTMCRKVGGGRTGFWDEKVIHHNERNDDGGSVRRFRVSIENEDKDEAQDEDEHQDENQGQLNQSEIRGNPKENGSRNEDAIQHKPECWHEKSFHTRSVTEVSFSSTAHLRGTRSKNKSCKPGWRKLLSCY